MDKARLKLGAVPVRIAARVYGRDPAWVRAGMEDADAGNRTGQWFWNMVVSLGLAAMDDNRFHQSRAEFVIERFHRRDYQPNGAGSLFTLQNPKDDMRTLDIWYQMMAYLNENDI